MTERRAQEIIAEWPEESREAASLVVEQYGEPHESTDSELIWYSVGPWKRIEAQRAFWRHEFPAPHTDSVESFIDYRVPAELYDDIGRFDGSVMIERTTGEVSARCHDEQANMLALNLVHDIVTGSKDTDQAREYYAREFIDARRKRPTPYMEQLHFEPTAGSAADTDRRVLSEEQLESAKAEGEAAGAMSS